LPASHVVGQRFEYVARRGVRALGDERLGQLVVCILHSSNVSMTADSPPLKLFRIRPRHAFNLIEETTEGWFWTHGEHLFIGQPFEVRSPGVFELLVENVAVQNAASLHVKDAGNQ